MDIRDLKPGDPVMALSVKQPWANLIATGRKTVEVRTRRTNYRGPLLIVASQTGDKWPLEIVPPLPLKKPDAWMWHLAYGLAGIDRDPLTPTGVSLCLAELHHCDPFTFWFQCEAMCPHLLGANEYAWSLRNVRPVRQVPVRGMPGLFRVPFPGFSDASDQAAAEANPATGDPPQPAGRATRPPARGEAEREPE